MNLGPNLLESPFSYLLTMDQAEARTAAARLILHSSVSTVCLIKRSTFLWDRRFPQLSNGYAVGVYLGKEDRPQLVWTLDTVTPFLQRLDRAAV